MRGPWWSVGGSGGLMMEHFWTSLIAGSYTALCLTMWTTAVVYVLKVLRNYNRLDAATAALMSGIAVTFTGHAFDQSLWTAANLDRALEGASGVKLSAWYALNIPLVVVLVKLLASLGAFFHLWVAFHTNRKMGPVIAMYSAAWVVVAAGVTYVTY